MNYFHLNLLIPLFAIGLLSNISLLQAQAITDGPNDRTIQLSIYGIGSHLLSEKEGEIEVEGIVKGKTPSASEDRFTLDLSDNLYYLQEFPATIRALQGKKEMHLRLNGSVDSIRFREGEYDIPWEYEPLFHLRALGRTHILNQDIAYFEVPIISAPLNLGTVAVTSVNRSIVGPRSEPIPYMDPSGAEVLLERRSGNAIYGRIYYSNKSSGPAKYQGVVVSHDSGLTYRMPYPFAPQSSPFYNEKILSGFFKPNGDGWLVVSTATPMKPESNVVYRTTDAGQTWFVDSLFTQYHIVGGKFVDDSNGWFVGAGQELEGTEADRILFATDDGGKTLSRVISLEDYYSYRSSRTKYNWMGQTDILPISRTHLLLNQHTGFINSNEITFIDGEWRAKQVEPKVGSFEQVKDSTAFTIRRTLRSTFPYQNLDTLFKTSDGGGSWQPLIAGDRLHLVSFFDQSRGCVVGESYALLTDDGGRTWRYVPFDMVLESKSDYPQSEYYLDNITGLWLDQDHLRVISTLGLKVVDLSFKDIPTLPVPRLDREEDWWNGDIR